MKARNRKKKFGKKGAVLASLKAAKLTAHQKEMDVIGAVAGELVQTKTELVQIKARLAALEKLGGVPGPKGEKGDPGRGFWG